MRVIFSNRAYASVLAETTEKIKTETGGLFLGTIIEDVWYVIEAIDPGPQSIFEVAYFEYDQKYTQHLINKIANLYDEKLYLIGLWHRHPGSFDQFSSTDDGTNTKYAAMRKEGAISALVNVDPNFRITMYQVNQPCNYQRIMYDVGDHLIPDKLLKFKTPEKFCSIMDSLLHDTMSVRAIGDYHKSVSLSSFTNLIVPYLRETKDFNVSVDSALSDKNIQELLIEEIIDDLTFMADVIGVETSMALNDNYLTVYQEAIDKTTKIYFMYLNENKTVIFSYNDKCYFYHKGLFTSAFEKAKNDKKKVKNTKCEKTNKNKIQNGTLNSVMKIIRFNRNEE